MKDMSDGLITRAVSAQIPKLGSRKKRAFKSLLGDLEFFNLNQSSAKSLAETGARGRALTWTYFEFFEQRRWGREGVTLFDTLSLSFKPL